MCYKKIITLIISILISNIALADEPRLMVFVSFSMPEKGLVELGEQVAKAGGVLVLRGAYQGSLLATFKKVQELNNNELPIIIHPKLFKDFDIKVVPTIVLSEGSVTDKVAGNISLQYALNLFAQVGHIKLKARGKI